MHCHVFQSILEDDEFKFPELTHQVEVSFLNNEIRTFGATLFENCLHKGLCVVVKVQNYTLLQSRLRHYCDLVAIKNDLVNTLDFELLGPLCCHKNQQPVLGPHKKIATCRFKV